MNVLVIAELFPPDMGGGSTRAFNVVRGLVSLGHGVTVVQNVDNLWPEELYNLGMLKSGVFQLGGSHC